MMKHIFHDILKLIQFIFLFIFFALNFIYYSNVKCIYLLRLLHGSNINIFKQKKYTLSKKCSFFSFRNIIIKIQHKYQ